MNEQQPDQRVRDEMCEIVRGLYDAGLIDERRLAEFDALCRLNVAEMPPERIERLQ